MRQRQNHQRRHLLILAGLAAGMFGFAFALVPLYQAFCELTGLNGRTSDQAVRAELTHVDSDRVITVQFLADVSKGMPWEFRPLERSMRVHPGEIHTAYFRVRNRSGQAITGQAVPSVSPGSAATSFQKIECFCFTQQRLGPGEEADLPVQFVIADDLPWELQTLSLSYTLFRVDDTPAGVSGG